MKSYDVQLVSHTHCSRILQVIPIFVNVIFHLPHSPQLEGMNSHGCLHDFGTLVTVAWCTVCFYSCSRP